ncbi:MAG: AMP-binding protein, partial [Acidimicrobiales bacterium]
MTELGFWTTARADPDRMAVVDAEEQVTTFGGLLGASNRVAHGLRGLGLERGDAIAAVLPNEPAFLELYLAATQIGLYITPVNFHLTGSEIAYILHDAEVKAFVVGERFAAAGREAAQEAGLRADGCFVAGKAQGFRSFEELKQGQPNTAPAERTAGQTMLYTSGTTGRPKGVRRPLPEVDPDTAAGLSALLASLFEVQPGVGVHLAAGPLYHAAPMAFGTGALHLGQGVVLMDKWTPERTLELIERYRV